MRSANTILIHPSRLHQLKLIAQATGKQLGRELAVTEQIEQFITAEIEKGTISDDIPGLKFERQTSMDGMWQLAVTAGDLAPVIFSWGRIETLTEKLFWAVKLPDEKLPGFDVRASEGGRWLFGRIGKGFVHFLTDAEGRSVKFTATPAMILDLHDKICATTSGTTRAELAKRHREAKKNAA